VEWSASVALTADRRSARRRCETGKGKTGGYSIRRVRRGRTRKIEWHDDVLDFRPFHWNWPGFFSPNKTPKQSINRKASLFQGCPYYFLSSEL
jgi:hypothetical protein